MLRGLNLYKILSTLGNPVVAKWCPVFPRRSIYPKVSQLQELIKNCQGAQWEWNPLSQLLRAKKWPLLWMRISHFNVLSTFPNHGVWHQTSRDNIYVLEPGEIIQISPLKSAYIALPILSQRKSSLLSIYLPTDLTALPCGPYGSTWLLFWRSVSTINYLSNGGYLLICWPYSTPIITKHGMKPIYSLKQMTLWSLLVLIFSPLLQIFHL